ncbi:Serine/threonine-protein kinase haspin [Acropora cervicornis]|uniref:non-specific serine/threonine protein kinase n=1 Tax=Acropora cervicornis TaxID=6130 RepID=A0AAD9R3U6_ACRCE|nr:Serine/threonine-protein kinase haspin [Acropora cervicornis]
MPKRPLVVKTYGRHKYRTVKAQSWLSPDETFLSPFGDQSRLPSKFEFNTSDTNLKPKTSRWENYSKKAQNSCQNGSIQEESSEFSDKENKIPYNCKDSSGDEVVQERRPQRKKRRQNLFNNLSPLTSVTQHEKTKDAELRDENVEICKPEIILANDSLEIREDNNLQEPPHQNRPKHDLLNNDMNGQSLNENSLGNSFSSCPQELRISDYRFGNSNSTCSRINSYHVTSTPMLNVKTSQVIPHKSYETGKLLSQSSLSGKPVLETLKITPIQGQKLSSDSEKSVSSCTDYPKRDFNQKNTVLKSWRTANGGDLPVDLKECVVRLEKLRITPLKKRSRNYERSEIITEDEALTPAKKKMPCWKSPEKEKVELSAFDKILLECDQKEPFRFADIIDSRVLKTCVKIGEGIYGEVFRAQHENGKASALKIIPVEGDFQVNGTPQKTFEEILPEIVISNVSCCQDKYPEHLLAEWDRWDEENSSENDRPDTFSIDQYFVVFEFSDGGKDLESFEFRALSEAWSVLHQVSLGLAVAENALEFEHRDLHWGNVLISRTGDEFIESSLLGENRIVPTNGVRVSLIDFTLSRLTKDGLTVFCNLAEDESLFTGKGDYQFDVYRLMKKATQNDWETFEPYTNALWLHYLADKLLKKKRYHRKEKDVESDFKKFLRQAKKCSSATELVFEFFGCGSVVAAVD